MGKGTLRSLIAVFACLVAQCQPIIAQVTGVKANSNTGALLNPLAATFRSANGIASGSAPSIVGTQKQVWLALRSDGSTGTITAPLTLNSDGTITVTGTAKITGTGTAVDPWDVADLTGVKFDALMRMLGRPVSTMFTGAITSVSTAGSGVTISTVSAASPTVITTSSPHGFGATGANVDLYISGVTGSTPAIAGLYRATILSTTTFSVPINVSVSGSGGTAQTPSIVTTTLPHGLQTGVQVTNSGISGATSSPSVNGSYPVIVTDSTHFEIPSNVTVSGTGGTFTSTFGVVGRYAIHLGPGVIYTMGTQIVDPTYSFPAYSATNYPTFLPDNSGGYTTTGWYAYDGWKIAGAGRGVTTLRLASWPQWGGSPYPYGVSVIGSSDGSLGYAGDDTEIADLSIDCNWQYLSGKPSPSHVVCTAIAMFGDRVHIHDVHQLNMYGNLAGLNEAFSINVANKLTDNYFGPVLGYPTITRDSQLVEIDHTFTDGWQGDYGSALAVGPGTTGSGMIHHNYVKDWLVGTSAIQVGGTGSSVFENTVDGAIVGVYSEALPGNELNNCLIYKNHFKRIRHSAVSISGGNGPTNGHCDSLVVDGNDVEFDFANASTPWGIQITGIGTLTNATISNNVITKTGTTGGSPLGITVTNWTGISVIGNTIDSAFGNSIASSSNVFLRGNKDQTRAVASGLTDTILPESLGGTGATSFTAGSVVFGGSTALSQDNSKLFYDSTNHRLGIGTTSPSTALDIGAGVLNLAATSSTNGQMSLGGNLFLHAAGGSSNVYLGTGAGNLTATAINNVGVGDQSLHSVLSGGYNVSIGHNNLPLLTTGSGVVAIGADVGYTLTTDGDDMLFGYGTFGNSTGSGVVAIGREAARSLGGGGGTANYCTFIGYQSQYNGTGGLTNSTAIGNASQVTASNCLVLGGTGGNQVNVSIGNTAGSDLLDIGKAGTISGAIRLQGVTSGYIRIAPSDAAGSWTLKLPGSAGTSGQILSTDGSGNSAWTNVLPSVAETDVTAQTTPAQTILTYTVGGSAGTFRVGGYVNVTAISGGEVIKFQTSWTDENGNAKTWTYFPQGSSVSNISAVSDNPYSPVDIRCQASSTITVKTFETTGGGAVTYDAGASIQQIK